MNLRQLSRLPGVSAPALLRATVRLRLGHREPRQLITLRVYEEADGGYIAIPSHVPSAQGKAGAAPKPTPKSQAPKPADLPVHPTPELAVESAVLALLAQADRIGALAWSPNPDAGSAL